MPYGIIYRQNQALARESIFIWQKRYGFLRLSAFLKVSVLPVIGFAVLYFVIYMLINKQLNVSEIALGVLTQSGFLFVLMLIELLRSVKAFTPKSEGKIQAVLKDEMLEITTAYSKEVIPYNEIELCVEKNFILTIIYDKNTIPLSVAKMQLEKGNYDMFVSLLKEKVSDKFIKKGEY